MDSTQESHDLQTKPDLWETLAALAQECGYSITSAECQAEYRRNEQNAYTRKLTIQEAKNGHSTWLRRLLVAILSDRLPTGEQRTISLPLDPRKGGEIRLTEEQVRRAMSQEQSVAQHRQTLERLVQAVLAKHPEFVVRAWGDPVPSPMFQGLDV